MKILAEQIAALEETRTEKAQRMEEISQKSMDEGRTMDDAEAQEFDTEDTEVKRIDEELVRLRKLERMKAATAKPVEEQARENESHTIKTGEISVRAKDTQKLEPGMGFARVARCLALSHVHHKDAAQIAQSIYPGDEQTIEVIGKASVPAANTVTPSWAGNLINEGGAAFADFVEYLRPTTLLGQVESRLRRLPFDTPVLIQGSGGSGAWVQEGNAKPLTQWTYSRTKLSPLKVAAIAAITKETLMRSSAAADMLIRDELARSVRATIDMTFIDPSAAAVPNESPASILNGVTALTAHGDTGVIGVRCDIQNILTTFADNNMSVAGAFWVMPERVAIALHQMVNEIGNVAFPGVTPAGGTLAGLPVYVSNYVPTDSNGSVVALVKGDEIFLGDEGGVQVSMSDQASLVMDDDPSMSSAPATGPAQMVSMWQTNSVAVLVERFLNWQRRRAEAVAWMYVDWTACETVS